MTETAIVILAGGKGTRMKSDTPKVLHKIGGLELILHVVRTARLAGASRITVVIPEDGFALRQAVHDFDKEVEFAVQKEQLGTAHALLAAAPGFRNFSGQLAVLYGDTPLITPDTVQAALQASKTNNARLSIVGMHPDNPFGYGRIILNGQNFAQRIVEEIDTDAAQKNIRLCYAGIIAGDAKTIFSLLKEVQPSPRKGEYFLTDIIFIGRSRGINTAYITIAESEVMGINDRYQLAMAETAFQARMRKDFLLSGITMADPATVYFSYDTVIEPDVIIGASVVFGLNVKVKSGAEIRPFCHIEGAEVSSGAVIGPFARLRPGTVIGENSHIGNFVEIKNSRLESGAKVNHLSYIGDSDVGANANIGAGTITCNYDGFHKYRTSIGDGAFIGSNSSLVAPVEIGDKAVVGAGSVITENVPPEALALGRARQQNKSGWAYVYRKKNH